MCVLVPEMLVVNRLRNPLRRTHRLPLLLVKVIGGVRAGLSALLGKCLDKLVADLFVLGVTVVMNISVPIPAPLQVVLSTIGLLQERLISMIGAPTSVSMLVIDRVLFPSECSGPEVVTIGQLLPLRTPIMLP